MHADWQAVRRRQNGAVFCSPPRPEQHANVPPSPAVAFLVKVLNHVGETWICFIRIMVKDPFDDQLDIRVIHDREEVWQKNP